MNPADQARMMTYGAGWVNTATGTHYHKDEAGQLVKIGTLPRWQILAIASGVTGAQISGPDDVGLLAEAYQAQLAPSMLRHIAEIHTKTEDVCALLRAIHRVQILENISDPRERHEHAEWLWAARSGLVDEPVWAYQAAQQLTGIVIDSD